MKNHRGNNKSECKNTPGITKTKAKVKHSQAAFVLAGVHIQAEIERSVPDELDASFQHVQQQRVHCCGMLAYRDAPRALLLFQHRALRVTVLYNYQPAHNINQSKTGYTTT